METRLKENGKITIPFKLCQQLNLSKGSILSVVKVANGILLSPKRSVMATFAKTFSKEAQEKGISLEDLIKDLKKIRRSKTS